MQIISGSDKASHKRIIAIYTTVVLLTVTCAVVWKKGGAKDCIYLAGLLIGFISGLVGVAAYETVKKKKELPSDENPKVN